MAVYKWTYRVKYISGSASPGYLNRAGSFTESVYWNSSSDSTRASFLALARARAGFLPNFTSITGIRVQQVDPSGPAQLQRVSIPGQAGTDFAQDIPQVAFLFSIPTNLQNVRKYITPAIPDALVKRGEPNLDNTDKALIRRWLLALNGWLSRGEDLTKPKVPIKTIDATGAYTLTADLVMAPQSTIKVYSAQKADGSSLTGEFLVESVTDSKHGILRGWTGGACTLGSMRQIVIVYPILNTSGFDLDSILVTTRQIGNPSERYRGQRRRKQRKRRTA